MYAHIGRKDFFAFGFPVCVMNIVHQGNVLLHDHSFYELVYIENGVAMHTWDKTPQCSHRALFLSFLRDRHIHI